MVIQATDRVARVLQRDERLLDVFVDSSPHFERLRNPAMRRVMARLVTVEQAARIAGVEVDALVQRLNAALATPSGGASHTPDGPAPGPTVRATSDSGAMPPALAATGPERWVDLDVRDDLRNGREPFARIMAAKAALTGGHVLRVRAIFEPAPLYAVLGKQGFAHWTERLADDDWRVWFYRDGAPDAGSPPSEPLVSPDRIAARRADPPRSTAEVEPDHAADAVPLDGWHAAQAAEPDATSVATADPVGADSGVVVLDVRGLEPPEPMVRTLAALESLPPDGTLVQINVRVPRFLLPRLEEMGYRYEIREQSADLVRLFIRHGDTRRERSS